MKYPLRLRASLSVFSLILFATGSLAADPKLFAAEIKFATPKRGDITRFVSLPGNVRPLQQATLFAKTPGYLKSINVDKGDAVKVGAVLAEIEAPELLADHAKTKADIAKAKADLAKYRADIAKAKADIAKANADLPRAKADADFTQLDYDRLHAARKKSPDLVTEQSVDAAKAKKESADAALGVAKAAQTSAQANLEAAQAALEAAQASVEVAVANHERTETLLGFTKISAPFAGVITARGADVGAFIPAGNGAGSVAVLTLMDFNTVRVQVAMTELEAPLVAKDQPVRVSVEGLPGRTFEGRVTRLAYALDDATKTMLVEAELPNPKWELRPGMYATVKIGVEKHTNALLVPTESLVMEKANAFVFTHVDVKAKKTAVKLGFNDGKNVEIANGLSGNEKVLLVGKTVLTDGQAVNTVEAK